MQADWAVRAVRTRNQDIRDCLEADPHPFRHHSDGSLPWTHRNSIGRAFFLSEAPTEASLSYVDGTDHRTSTLRDLTIFEPVQEYSLKAALWAPHLEDLREKGWRIAYTDGSGTEGRLVEGVFLECVCGTRTSTHREYLGPTASVAHAERLAMPLALQM